MRRIKAYKEGAFLIFQFDDGKNVKYNLATGETIGKRGLPVKEITPQLSGYDLLEVIDSFEDENYRMFLKFIDEQFINRSRSRDWHRRVDKISNVGSFVSRIKNYPHYEQYFSAGIHNIERDLKYKITDLPRGLLNICRENNVQITNNLVEAYKGTGYLHEVLRRDYNTLSKRDIANFFSNNLRNRGSSFSELIDRYGYNPISLIRYIDNLMTYEALDGIWNISGELRDYARMLSQISPRYEKYPKNFLTAHRIATRSYNRLREKFDEDKFNIVVDRSLEFSCEDYVVIYPHSTQEIKDEAVQQNNCVASYIQNVLNGTTHILFMREKDEPDKSLVTLQVSNNKVVQAKRRFNNEVSKRDEEIIDRYNDYLKRREQNACKVS